MVPSLEAHRQLKASLQLCSWGAGWRSVLLREYLDRPCEDEFTTAATPDHLFVLLTGGSCTMESHRGGHWQTASHRVGNVAMRSPGRTSTIRWRSHEPHQTLHLYLPAAVITRQLAELSRRTVAVADLPNMLSCRDPMIQSTLLTLRDAMVRGLPDLYAETAAELLAAHLLLNHCDVRPLPRLGFEDRRLHRVDTFMREHLGEPVSLAELAQVAGLSRFHFLRLYKRTYGETPLKRLTRMRMDEAKRRLLKSNQPITEIASQCGYENPANFASAFRRLEGVSPREYRQPAP
jgi:AraC family transcriptional regulator